jgi:integrase
MSSISHGGVWLLCGARTKTGEQVEIPLTAQVMAWLDEVRVFACGSPYLFPVRRHIRMRCGQARKNRHEHVSPDALNVAMKRLSLNGIEHFTVRDMRRTARTRMAVMGVNRFVAERALNHKLRDVEGVYDRHDYFDKRDAALERWSELLESIRLGKLDDSDLSRAAARIREDGNVVHTGDGERNS